MPAAFTDTSVTLVWNTDIGAKTFEIYQDNKRIAVTGKDHFHIGRLKPSTKYKFVVKAVIDKKKMVTSNALTVQTKNKGRIFDIRDFGAKADSTMINTKQIQAAIDACTKDGIVYIPKGVFVTGGLFVNKSNITIYLEKGAVLKASHSLADFPMIKLRYEGYHKDAYSGVITCGTLNGERIKNISIRGSGTIDGQGSVLSQLATETSGRMSRAHGLLMLNCDSVYLQGFTIQNSPTWCIHPVYCNHLTTEAVFIKTDGYGVSNADGWNPDSSTDCYLVDSEFWTHDDCVAIKSGTDEEGRKVGKPSEDIYISWCTFHKGGGLALGSEMSGSIRRVYVSDCHFESVDRGLIIKTRRKRGGIVEDVLMKNITANRFGNWGIFLEMRYNKGASIPPQPAEATPVFRNFRFENIHIKTAVGPAIIVSGLPESHIENVVFKDIHIENAKEGVFIDSCRHISFQNISFNAQSGPKWTFADTADIRFAGKTSAVFPAPRRKVEMVDPGATKETIALYKNLKKIAGSKVLFGQQDATSSGYKWKDTSGRCDIREIAGVNPAVYSWDFMDFTRPGADNSFDRRKIARLTTEAYQRGAVNSYCWHFFNPVTNGSFYDTTIVVKHILPGGAYLDRFKQELQRVAAYAKELRGSKGEAIPIIFRPFHEMDGSWFWWGRNFCTPEEFRQLYRFTVQYLRDSMQVHNFIYAFSPDCKFNTEAEYLERYPGDEYVDIIGMDNYWDFRFNGGNLDNVYNKLMIISNYAAQANKIAALTETGQKNIEDSTWFTQKLLQALLGYPQQPKLAYVALWRNSEKGYWTPHKDHPAVNDFLEFCRNPYIIFENKLPDMYK